MTPEQYRHELVLEIQYRHKTDPEGAKRLAEHYLDECSDETCTAYKMADECLIPMLARVYDLPENTMTQIVERVSDGWAKQVKLMGKGLSETDLNRVDVATYDLFQTEVEIAVRRQYGAGR